MPGAAHELQPLPHTELARAPCCVHASAAHACGAWFAPLRPATASVVAAAPAPTQRAWDSDSPARAPVAKGLIAACQCRQRQYSACAHRMVGDGRALRIVRPPHHHGPPRPLPRLCHTASPIRFKTQPIQARASKMATTMRILFIVGQRGGVPSVCVWGGGCSAGSSDRGLVRCEWKYGGPANCGRHGAWERAAVTLDSETAPPLPRRRLLAVHLVALGIFWLLQARTLPAPPLVACHAQRRTTDRLRLAATASCAPPSLLPPVPGCHRSGASWCLSAWLWPGAAGSSSSSASVAPRCGAPMRGVEPPTMIMMGDRRAVESPPSHHAAAHAPHLAMQ